MAKNKEVSSWLALGHLFHTSCTGGSTWASKGPWHSTFWHFLVVGLWTAAPPLLVLKTFCRGPTRLLASSFSVLGSILHVYCRKALCLSRTDRLAFVAHLCLEQISQSLEERYSCETLWKKKRKFSWLNKCGKCCTGDLWRTVMSFSIFNEGSMKLSFCKMLFLNFHCVLWLP